MVVLDMSHLSGLCFKCHEGNLADRMNLQIKLYWKYSLTYWYHILMISVFTPWHLGWTVNNGEHTSCRALKHLPFGPFGKFAAATEFRMSSQLLQPEPASAGHGSKLCIRNKEGRLIGLPGTINQTQDAHGSLARRRVSNSSSALSLPPIF